MRDVFAHSGGPRRAGALHPVRLEADRQRRLRRQDQSLGFISGSRPQETGQCAMFAHASGKKSYESRSRFT